MDQQHQSRRKYKLWLLILMLTPCIGIGILWLIGSTGVNGRLVELRGQGMPTNVQELNAFYVVPTGADDATQLWVTAIDGIDVLQPIKGATELPIIGTGPTPVPPLGELWDQLDAARLLLQELQPQMQDVRTAVSAGGVARFPVDFTAGFATLLPYTQSIRQVVRLLQLDAHVSAHDGLVDQAFLDTRSIFTASDTLQAEPTLISQLVRIALHAMGCELAIDMAQQCDWTDSQLESIQESAAAANFLEEMQRALRGERAMTLTALDRMTLGPRRQSNKGGALQMFEIGINGMDVSWSEAIAATQQISTQITGLRGSSYSRIMRVGILLVFPAVEQATISGARATARQRCVIIALAAKRHQLLHGDFPDSMTELQALLPMQSADMLVDPFTDKPLKYVGKDGSVTIYSVGDDQIDDGGSIDNEKETGPSTDVGVRMKRQGCVINSSDGLDVLGIAKNPLSI